MEACATAEMQLAIVTLLLEDEMSYQVDIKVVKLSNRAATIKSIV